MLIITITNKSNLAPVSDYEYWVGVNHRCLEKGTITGHVRAEGWPRLVQMLLDKVNSGVSNE